LNLPVFNNDAIRSEVIEDLWFLDEKEQKSRRNTRVEETLKDGNSFICDISVDRVWKEFKEMLDSYGYEYFIISIDLSKDLLVKLYEAKEYFNSLKRIDELVQDHKLFLDQYSDDINLHILDKNFKDRLFISYDAVETLMK